LKDGLDIYNFPELDAHQVAQFDVDQHTSQGLAGFRSGSLAVCPKHDGGIIILNSHDASLVAMLRYPST
jgi:hypothetical protein